MRKCPRCSSSFTRTEQDRYGEYKMCLNCGWTDNGITVGRRRYGYEQTPDGQVAAGAESEAKVWRILPALPAVDIRDDIKAVVKAR